MFPLGLLALINRHAANAGGWGVLIGCYGVYLVHGFFYFCSKTALQTAVLYGILIILLLGNIAGCRGMMHSH